jgi:hypothetical protein
LTQPNDHRRHAGPKMSGRFPCRRAGQRSVNNAIAQAGRS